MKVKFQRPDFEAPLQGINADEEKREQQERDRPRKEFIALARTAGFSKVQAEFMWRCLAQSTHQHWDGRVG